MSSLPTNRHPVSPEECNRLMKEADWRMKWEILPGIITPGDSPFDPVYILNEFGTEADLRGKTAIDIGCWDGAIAFELEKRGAKVLATDIQDPDNSAFNVAKKILGSNMEYLLASVYDLPKLLPNKKFDLVVFRAIYYHLKDPIRAFEAIHEIMDDNGLLYIDGECLKYYAETLDGKPVYSKNIKELAESEIPISLIYPGTYKKGDNWFVPNFACFKGWMQATGLSLDRYWFWEDRKLSPPGQRLIAVVKKLPHSQPRIEHGLLKKFWKTNRDH